MNIKAPGVSGADSSSRGGTEPPSLKAAGTPASKWDWEQALKDRSRGEGMTPGCQHVALLMSTYANGDGTSIRPTVQTLAAVSGKSRASVHEALRYLRDEGWLLQVSKGAGASRKASEYRLTVPSRVQ